VEERATVRRSRALTGRRGEGEAGVALAEFALIAPLLFMLLLGMVTAGLAYNKKLAITNGAREGSRYGATLPVTSSTCTSGGGTLDCWLSQVADVAASASEGNLGSAVSSREICVAYVYPAGVATNDHTRKLVRTSGGDAFTDGSSCFSDGRPTSERRVQVVTKREAEIDFLIGSAKPTLRSESVTKFEGVAS
jgi:hypothetical protein